MPARSRTKHKIVSGEYTDKEKRVIFNNRVSAARRKLAKFKKDNGLPPSVLGSELIIEYAKYLGKEPPSQKKATQWLYKLYEKGEDELIKKGDSNDGFYSSPAWRKMKQTVLFVFGKVCMKCKSTKNIHVDHIKPRSLYPELELDINNMQVLCRPCNCAKSNRGAKDYRGLPDNQHAKFAHC